MSFIALNQMIGFGPELFYREGNGLISVMGHRIVHFLKNGEWVNEEVCLKKLIPVSASQVDVQEAFNKSIAQQYPTYAASPKHNVFYRAVKGVVACVKFILQFIHSPSTIGSLFPSSSRLVKKITRMIPEFDATDTTPRRFLEIGAGTGVFTEEIVKKLKPEDHFDIVEYDGALCEILREKFEHLPNVFICHRSILDFTPVEKYDVVVSGLPLNAFDRDFVESVLHKYREVTKEGGFLSYFEYMALGKIKQCFLKLFGRDVDFSRVLEQKESFLRSSSGVEVDNVWLNLTPARAIHCKL